jgi:hypothetical protein
MPTPAPVHASFHNRFGQERYLVDRQTNKLRRSAALAEWMAWRGTLKATAPPIGDVLRSD